MKKLLSAFLLFLMVSFSWSQSCEFPGQKPSTAFPVCGTNVFNQIEVPICRTSNLTVPGCTGDGADYGDKNPYWYKFTCYETGTLGFLITPKDLGDDYDWQLYDITGRDPNEVFTNAALVVTGNWAGTYGTTGASRNGVSFIQCASDPAANRNSFSTMPQLIKGHDYLLLVSHYTASQSGYSLSFGGGSAVITDTVLPHLKQAIASCSGDLIRLKLNKKMKCSSVASDGSDFFILGGGTVTGSVGFGCSIGFDTDSLEIKLDKQLTPGNYQLGVKKGSDGNTLLDFCDNSLSETERISFTVFPIVPTPMDSMEPVTCAPQTIKLLFRNPIACASIASDASDFSITGSYAVGITSVKGTCNNNGYTNDIEIILDKPLQQKGNFTLVLKKGTDGNTLTDECAKETLAGSSLVFSVKDTVNADFTYSISYSCTRDDVSYFHAGGDEVNGWKWNLDDNKTSNQQNPVAAYTNFKQKNINLLVSNGFCTDTAKQTITLENLLEVDFSVRPDNCPLEVISFKGKSIGKIVAHNWSFGDGGSSAEESPEHSYQQPIREINFPVRYIVKDNFGCEKSVTKTVTIYSSCTVYVPNAFTPNNDGLNDVFRILNGVKTENFNLVIYNRWGQQVFETKNWKQSWDGRYKGVMQASGTFVWFIRYTDTGSNKKVEQKGTVTIIL